jgi:hypothetical protein
MKLLCFFFHTRKKTVIPAATSTNANAPTTPPAIGATEEEPDLLLPPAIVVPFAVPEAPDALGLLGAAEPGWFGEEPEEGGEEPVVCPGEEAAAPVPTSALPAYVKATVAGKVGKGPVMLLSLTSKVLSAFKPTNPSGTGPVRLFPFKMMVTSEVRFASEGEMVPNKPSLVRMSDTTSPLALHVTPVHPQGSAPTQVEATACGYPAAARKSSNELTATEHVTPGPPQKVVLS